MPACLLKITQRSISMKLFLRLIPLSKRQICFGCALLIFMIGVGDYLVGPQLSTSLFYIFPIAVCGWHCSRRLSVAYSFVSAIVWFFSDKFSGQVYSHFLIPYWNSATRLCIFLIIAYLLSGYRRQLVLEENLADTDPLTGAFNRRAFYEKVATEIERQRRFFQPFSLAYIDLDNFKYVNDNLGHATGDLLLQKITEIMKTNTRVIDTIARVGGDEFAIIFTDTGSKSAVEVVEKLQTLLLATMREEEWPVTFSIGVVTCDETPDSVEHIVNFADGLMYSVKKSGKNRVAHAKLQKVPSSK